ncbi:DUF1642 domain-containing protein [Enterococcus faecium]|uniref:DUF1642 domain-containing protein n=2 Tax=Enterococcus TaxID=1350 RepID=UPI0012E16F6C|nr:DUF1642 domain-containing protein [Enterococcus faecium]QHU88396.1 DUF1642 domain-containing protein [Enterococcus faecium]UWS52556.1 DUF1642 domain-containing protein [Enterococcus faecium]
MNKQELIDKQALINKLTKYVERYEGATDEYYQGKRSAYEIALKSAKKLRLDEPQKPVVPKFVAEWFEDNKHALDLTIFIAIRGLNDEEWPHKTDFENWLDVSKNKPIETLVRMKDGYEVEKEPLYEVIIGDLYLIKKFNNRNDFYFDTSCSLCAWEKSAYQLTEAEIKAIDERYWPFAVPVEEGLEQEEEG